MYSLSRNVAPRIGRIGQGVAARRRAAARRAHIVFELARFDYCRHANELEAKKKFELVERVCSGLFAFASFFHQCHDAVGSVAPRAAALQARVASARRAFAAEQRPVQ